EPTIQQRLSQIETAWTLVKQAHADPADADVLAQAALIERYQTAVYRYLLGATRNADTADELFQEFALRIVRGSFKRADESRGRFRDFVKSALINLVINHGKKRGRMAGMSEEFPEPSAPPAAPFASDE